MARLADLTVDDPQGAEKSLHHFIGQQLIDALMAQTRRAESSTASPKPTE